MICRNALKQTKMNKNHIAENTVKTDSKPDTAMDSRAGGFSVAPMMDGTYRKKYVY
jgi:hypothetical protein